MESQFERILRERRITRLDLVFLAGVSSNTIYGIEKHNHRPRPEVAKRIAKALGVAVRDIWPEPEGKEGGKR